MTIKVFLADDHKILRESLIILLQQENDLEVIGEAADGHQALDEILRLKPVRSLVWQRLPQQPAMFGLGPPSLSASYRPSFAISLCKFALNWTGTSGLVQGNVHQFLIQVFGVVITGVYTFVVTYLILKVINVFDSVRVPEKVEIVGLDTSIHGEVAYDL